MPDPEPRVPEPSLQDQITSILKQTDGTGLRAGSPEPAPEPEPDPEAPEAREEPAEPAPQEGPEAPAESESESEPEGESPKDEPAVEGEDAADLGEEVPVYQFRVNGKTEEVGLDQLVRHYQQTKGFESSYHQRQAAFQQERSSFDLERTKYQQEVQQQVQKLKTVFEQVASLAQEEPEKLEALRKSGEITSDEYLERKINLMERQEKLQRQALEAQQAIERERAAREPYERAHLLRLLPEWSDEARRKEEAQAMEETVLQHYGIPLDVARNLATDHRFIALATDAMRYRRAVQSKSDAIKKVRTLPKVVKPGTPKQQGPVRNQKAQDAYAQLKKTGSKRAAANFFTQIEREARQQAEQRGRPV